MLRGWLNVRPECVAFSSGPSNIPFDFVAVSRVRLKVVSGFAAFSAGRWNRTFDSVSLSRDRLKRPLDFVADTRNRLNRADDFVALSARRGAHRGKTHPASKKYVRFCPSKRMGAAQRSSRPRTALPRPRGPASSSGSPRRTSARLHHCGSRTIMTTLLAGNVTESTFPHIP
jgi:hypothetical protein